MENRQVSINDLPWFTSIKHSDFPWLSVRGYQKKKLTPQILMLHVRNIYQHWTQKSPSHVSKSSGTMEQALNSGNFCIALDNGPFTLDLPIKMVMFHRFSVNVYQRVNSARLAARRWSASRKFSPGSNGSVVLRHSRLGGPGTGDTIGWFTNIFQAAGEIPVTSQFEYVGIVIPNKVEQIVGMIFSKKKFSWKKWYTQQQSMKNPASRTRQ